MFSNVEHNIVYLFNKTPIQGYTFTLPCANHRNKLSEIIIMENSEPFPLMSNRDGVSIFSSFKRCPYLHFSSPSGYSHVVRWDQNEPGSLSAVRAHTEFFLSGLLWLTLHAAAFSTRRHNESSSSHSCHWSVIVCVLIGCPLPPHNALSDF